MSELLAPTVDASAAGFDADRLSRLPAFFADRYIDSGLLPGFSLIVARGGEIVHSHAQGMADVATARPFELDTIVRIYSMTKAITSVAVLQCVEEGVLALGDPVSTYLPALWNPRVYASGSAMTHLTRPAAKEPTIQDLLRHTAGYSYGWHMSHPVDTLYRRAGVASQQLTNAEMVEQLGQIPLVFEPGTKWRYSVSVDVLGAVLEVLHGMPLDEVLSARVTGPLGMADTAFWVDDDRADRLASCYVVPSAAPFGVPEGAAGDVPIQCDGNGAESQFRSRPNFLSGGGGMVGTIGDYWKFCEMLRAGGTYEGVRLLGRPTVDLARRNHLPHGATISSISSDEVPDYEGLGFGLGFSVVVDPAATAQITTPGEFAWGGAASTVYWIDPVEDLTVVAMTQLLPSGLHPMRSQLRALIYGAMT